MADNINQNNDDLQKSENETTIPDGDSTSESVLQSDEFKKFDKRYGDYVEELRKRYDEMEQYYSQEAIETRRAKVMEIAPHLYENIDFVDELGSIQDPYYLLAHAYLRGIPGFEQDTEKGLELLKKCADKYNAEAMYDYARILASGKVCEVDFGKAAAYACEGIGHYDSPVNGVAALCDEALCSIHRAIFNKGYDYFVNYWAGVVYRKASDGKYVMKHCYDTFDFDGKAVKVGEETPLNPQVFKLPTEFESYCIPISKELYDCFGAKWAALPFNKYGNILGDKDASLYWEHFKSECEKKEDYIEDVSDYGINSVHFEEVSPEELHKLLSIMDHLDDVFFKLNRDAHSADNDIDPNMSNDIRVEQLMRMAQCYAQGLHGVKPAEDEWSLLDVVYWLQEAAQKGSQKAKEMQKKYEDIRWQIMKEKGWHVKEWYEDFCDENGNVTKIKRSMIVGPDED